MTANTRFSFEPTHTAGTATQGAGGNGGGGGYEDTRPPSDNQISLYIKMCQERQIVPVNLEGMTRVKLSNIIQHMRENPTCTPAQFRIIKEVSERLRGINVSVPEWTDEQIRNTSLQKAGEIIEKLIAKEQQMNQVRPPSDVQLQQLVEMYLYPEVEFESFGIEKKIYLDHIASYSTLDVETEDYTVHAIITTTERSELANLEDRAWRFMTADEFGAECEKKLTYREASRLLDQHRAGYRKWKQERATNAQARQIRQIEERLANIYVPQRVETAVDLYGIELEDSVSSTSSTDRKSPVAYEGVSDHHIRMMSRREADTYILQLQWELRNIKSSGYQDNQMDNAQVSLGGRVVDDSKPENRDGFNDFESIRGADSVQKAIHADFTALNDIMYQLQAIAGYEDADFQNEVVRSFYEQPDSKGVERMKSSVKEMMGMLIKEQYLTFASLVSICEKSEVAQEILMGQF